MAADSEKSPTAVAPLSPSACASTKRPELVASFLADLALIADERLVEDGFAVSEESLGPPMGVREISVLYRHFNLRLQRPVARPRRVHRSLAFRWPSQWTPELIVVEAELRTGSDITRRLSRRLSRPLVNNNPRRNDRLLADWDIHHLHLRPEGANELLFCILEPDDAYLVGVRDHDSFSEPELLRIAYDSWPELFVRAALHAAGATTKANVAAARAGNFISLVALSDDIVLMPRGGGLSSSGHSLRATMLATTWARIASRWEDDVRSQVPDVLCQAAEVGKAVPSELVTKLVIQDGAWCVLFPCINAVMPLPNPHDVGGDFMMPR